MPRHIAVVEQGDTKLYFFGVEEVYPDDDNEDIVALTPKARDCRKDAARIEGAREATALRNVKEIAEQMAGKNAAFCKLGRERSAIAIFSVLYVKFGLTKAEAAAKVLAAVEASCRDLPETEKDKIVYQTKLAIHHSEGFPKLPERCH